MEVSGGGQEAARRAHEVVDGLQQPVRARGLVRAAEQWADAGCTGGVGGWSCPWEWGCPELVLRAACHGSCQAIVVGAVVGCWSSWVGVWPVFAARQAHSPFGVLARGCVLIMRVLMRVPIHVQVEQLREIHRQAVDEELNARKVRGLRLGSGVWCLEFSV